MASSDAALIERFLEMMAAERGVARNTISAYQSDLMAASRLTGGQLVPQTNPATGFGSPSASSGPRIVQLAGKVIS